MTENTLRTRLARRPILIAPGVYDALTGLIAEQAGFEALYVSGAAIAYTRLGRPDIGLVSMNEVVETVALIRDRVGAQLVVDADTGYGNALSAIRTARGLFAAGASGLFLEDQVWPKKCGHFAGKRVVPADEWLAKLRAVVDLSRDGIDLFVVARTDARAVVSLDDALARARAAMQIGVDAIFVEAPQSIEELEAIVAGTPGAIRVANMVEGGRTPLLSPAELHELGFDVVVTPLTALMSATRAIQEAFAILVREGTMRDHRDRLVDFAEFGWVVEMARHQALDAQYASENIDPA
jgi:2-methylisocitrate lyase-like PEP mutase family enzyme